VWGAALWTSSSCSYKKINKKTNEKINEFVVINQSIYLFFIIEERLYKFVPIHRYMTISIHETKNSKFNAYFKAYNSDFTGIMYAKY
tara:strand:+ start:1257 stop:1517 length:261 start_codon:yes stop_codon:yes gene_type:complete